MYWILLVIFCLLSVLGKIGSFYAEGIFIWLSFLTLALGPILLGNLVLFLILLIRKKGRYSRLLPLASILIHLDFITAIFQPWGIHSFTATSSEGQPLRIITYNADNFCPQGIKTLKEAAETIREIHPDILCLQEAPNRNHYHPDSIKKAFGYLPYSHQFRKGGYLSISIFSQYPIEEVHPVCHPESSNISLVADIRINDRKIRLFNNHLQTTSVNENKKNVLQDTLPRASRIKATKEMILKMKSNAEKRKCQADSMAVLIQQSPDPVIVCGDFNDIPASYTYHKMKGNLIDSFKESGSGYQYTYRAIKRFLRIDYIFHSEEFKGTRCYSPDYPYSDHNMVVWEGVLMDSTVSPTD